MAQLVPDVGTCSYNGVSFTAFTTTAIDGSPIYDSAKRTVVYVVWAIRLITKVTSDIGAGTTTDATLDSIKAALLTPGGAFAYSNKGFGTFSINVATVKDVIWGPRPTMFKWRPLGNTGACEVEWGVEVAIPQCPGSAAYQNAIMELNYKLAFAIDAAGYTRRTYSGHVRIPQTRVSVTTRTLTDSADGYLEQINPQCPPGFRRVTRERTLSEDKCTLDFTYVDEEMPPQMLQDGVIECSAEHTMTSRGRSTKSWVGTISASYEMAREVPKEESWSRFRDLAESRLDEAKKANKGVVFHGLQIRETEIFGRKAASFTLNYLLVADIQELFTVAGLWKPVDADWARWATGQGILKSVFHPRGNAGLYFRTNEDAIIDLCLQSNATPGANGSTLTNPRYGLSKDLKPECPPPDKSWLMYECDLWWEEQQGVIELKPLPVSPIPPDDGRGARQTIDPSSTDGYPTKGPDGPKSIVQRRTSTIRTAVLRGKALRACYRIPEPRLLSVTGVAGGLGIGGPGGAVAGGSVTPIPANRPDMGDGFMTFQAATWGVPCYGAVWQLRYIVPEGPGAPLLYPSNPAYLPGGNDF